MGTDVRLRRSFLFVPASRPDRYEKALATRTDAVCIDLEDGVASSAKEDAREKAFEILRQPQRGRVEVILRINDPKTELGLRDLLAFCESGTQPDALMLPKVMSPSEVGWVEGILRSRHPDLPLVPMVETARGLAAAEEIATSSPLITCVFLGGIDLASELGCVAEWSSLLYARSRVVHAGALAGVGALDTPYMDVADLEGLAKEARASRRLGFTGKAAIHPSQVPVIQDAFSPSDAEVKWALRIVQAYEANTGGVLLVEGKLIERPVISAARRTLAIAEAVQSESQA